jgi:hypothetical protein
VFYNQSSHAMLRQTVDSITLLLAPFSARLVLTGTYLSEFTLRFKNFSLLYCCRVRERLKNGEIVVAGDQWPLLLYADCVYDPEDSEPWDGLFRNKLLVWVRFQRLIYAIHFVEAHNL